MKRVLAFHCHPDDVEYHVAGTLVLLYQAGYEIHIATMAGGEVGSSELAPQQIRALRLKEAGAAAAVLDGHYHYAGGHDLQIRYDEEQLRQAVRIVRTVAPQIVFAPPPMDYLVDHEETSRLVRTAAFVASVPNYDCGVPTEPVQHIPHLYYCQAMGRCDPFGRPLPLHMAVDITEVIDVKRRMLACHASQRAWLRHINGMDNYLDNMEADAREQGRLIGVTHAEGYIQHLGYGHPTDNILGRILGRRCTMLADMAGTQAGSNIHG